MSKIHRVKTELRNGASLQAALERTGLPFKLSAALERNDLRLVDYYGNTTNCAAMIERDALQAALGIHCYGGLGFVWNGQGYDVAVDHYDTNYPQYQALLSKINQDYTLAEIQTYARENPNLTYSEETLPDGTVRVLLHGMRY